MDQELREAFATLSAQMSGVDANAREAASRSRETAAAVSRLTGDVETLKAAVFGSTPPPPAAPAVMARITEGEGTVADLTGRVMALAAAHEEHVKATAEYRKQNDAKQDEQLETLRAIKGVLTHPLARKVALAAGVAILAWLGTVQARIEARAEKIEQDVSRFDGGGK